MKEKQTSRNISEIRMLSDRFGMLIDKIINWFCSKHQIYSIHA
jgi:hypothetical protein